MSNHQERELLRTAANGLVTKPQSQGSDSSVAPLTRRGFVGSVSATAAAASGFGRLIAPRPAMANAAQLTFSRGTYIGQVATGTILCSSTGQMVATPAPALTYVMSRSPHIMRDNPPWFRIALPAWYVGAPTPGTNNEIIAGGVVTWSAVLEYPATVLTQIYFGGATTIQVGGGTTLFSDQITNIVPVGARFWILLYQACPTGGTGIMCDDRSALNPQAGERDSVNGEQVAVNASGFVLGNHTGNWYVNGISQFPFTSDNGVQRTDIRVRPCAIVGPTTKPSIALVGDSRFAGLLDTFTDGQGEIGEAARSIGPNFAYMNLSRSSESLANFLQFGARRMALQSFCSHAVENLGGNDLIGGTPASAVLSGKPQLWNMFPRLDRLFSTTIAPVTSLPITISNAANNGSGNIRLSLSSPLNLAALSLMAGSITNAMVAGVQGVNANGSWTGATIISSTQVDLPQAIMGTYTGGGTVIVQHIDEPAIQSFNAARRAGGTVSTFDIASVVESYVGSGYWGTQNGNSITTDGTHENAIGNLLIKNSTAIPASAFYL